MANPLSARPTVPQGAPDRGRPLASSSQPRLELGELEELLNCAPNAVICLDREYNFIYANQPALHLTGQAELVGKNLWATFPGNLDDPYYSSYKSTMEQRTETTFEAYYAAPLFTWFEVMARPIELGIAIFFNEINTRKQAEAVRDRTMRQLQQVFAVTNDGVLMIDRQWRITFLNRRAHELLAVKGDLTGKVLWEEFPPTADPNGPYLELYKRTMEERIPTELEAFYPEPLNGYYAVESVPSDDGIVQFFRDVTERHLWEESNRAQQDLLAAVQQGALVATWSLDTASGKIEYGQGSSPVFGRPLEELQTLSSLLAIVCPQDKDRIMAATRDAVRDRTLFTVEFEVEEADGHYTWVECRGQVLTGSGKDLKIGGIAMDISARKKSESALAASEARYRMLTEENPQAIWMASTDGRMTYANRRFLDYTGAPFEAFAGDGWLERIDEADREEVAATWRRAIATGEEFRREMRLVRGEDGTARWWAMRGLPVRERDGRIVNWLGVAIDIDDGKTATDELLLKQHETERQRAELEAVYQSAGIGLALFSAGDLRFQRANEVQAEIVGLPVDRIVGRTLMEIAPDVPGIEQIFRHVEQGNSVRDLIVEGELPARPGELRTWSVSYTPVFGDKGKVVGITAASLEITKQKRAEAALLHSEKLATVGRLASSISHEINNPLEAVTNLLYIVATDEALNEELRGYIETAQQELARVSQIATQTLRFHRQASKPTVVTAAALVDAVMNLYQGRLFNSGIEVQTSYKTAEPIVCYENDIRQVLNNLIANAIDAMEGGGRLLVRAHAVRDLKTSARRVRITIADTGHGMSRATASRIFDPFFTTKDLNGTGLGLWISAEIVKRHHGHLLVRSSKGLRNHGTVFTLVLPCNETPDEAPNPSAYTTVPTTH